MRSTLIFAIGLLFGVYSAHAQSNPVQVATQARFDLRADVSVGSLTNESITTDDANIMRQTWVTNLDASLTYAVNFGIVSSTWTKTAFTFTPASNGVVTLSLLGPWEEASSGTIYRQEVLWDDLSAKNATITNGSFEVVKDGEPAGWTRAYGDSAVDTGPVTPVDGTNYVRTWHNAPMRTTFTVTGGQPVTLTFSARAYRPAKKAESNTGSNTNAPAH